jgi:hypothetical protein
MSWAVKMCGVDSGIPVEAWDGEGTQASDREGLPGGRFRSLRGAEDFVRNGVARTEGLC